MKARDRAYNAASSSGTAMDPLNFRSARAVASNVLDSAENSYIASRLNEAPSPEAKWKELRRLRVSVSTSPLPYRYFVAATLNTHYAATVNRHPPITELDFDTAVNHPISTAHSRQFDLCSVTEPEVLNALNRSSSEASGLDGISTLMLKLARKTALANFTFPLNYSIANATFPSEWKKALLRPLAKTKSPRLPYNTRSIALLSESSKVLERLVHEQQSGYHEVDSLLSPRQAAVRRGHSTQTALLGVLEEVRQAIDDHMLTILILFDFSKAFYSIPNARLLAKLRALNLSDHALRWIFNYLADRLQAVVEEGGAVSDWFHASSGVTQGSVLGPLLFAIYLNNLPAALSFARIMIYADDTQVYLHFCPSHIHQ